MRALSLAAAGISAGEKHTCAIGDEGELACWGLLPGSASPPQGRFLLVTCGSGHSCALTDPERHARCWGTNSHGEVSDPPKARAFKSLSVGLAHTCGVYLDSGELACWGYDDDGQAASGAPPGEFQSVDAGAYHTCAVRGDGRLACWGQEAAVSAVPDGAFESVTAGFAHSCAVATTSVIQCWGGMDEAKPPTGAFSSVSAGDYHTCAVRSDQTVACWGFDGDDQASPPPEAFREVSAGGQHTCGELTNGDYVCWGDDSFGQCSPMRDFVRLVIGASIGGLFLCMIARWCWRARRRRNAARKYLSEVSEIDADVGGNPGVGRASYGYGGGSPGLDDMGKVKDSQFGLGFLSAKRFSAGWSTPRKQGS